MVGFGSGALGRLVQGSQQITALEEVQVTLQWDVDLTVVTGQFRQTGGLERRAQQTTGDTCGNGRDRQEICSKDLNLEKNRTH